MTPVPVNVPTRRKNSQRNSVFDWWQTECLLLACCPKHSRAGLGPCVLARAAGLQVRRPRWTGVCPALCPLECFCFLQEPGASANVGFKTAWLEINVSGQKAWEAACEGHAVSLSHTFESLHRAPDKSIYYTWLLMFEGIYFWTGFWDGGTIHQLLTRPVVLSLQAALHAFRHKLPGPCPVNCPYVTTALQCVHG